jgi:hypothetical protein
MDYGLAVAGLLLKRERALRERSGAELGSAS